MELKFLKMNPTQNMTILVETPVERNQHRMVASRLMDYDSVFAEQVGFIERPVNSQAWSRLQMMAGEFCGNATMSLAAFLAIERNIPFGQSIDIPLETSGAEDLVHCQVVRHADHVLATLAVPAPKNIETRILTLNGREHEITAVDMNGITHLIVPVQKNNKNLDIFAETAAKAWQPFFDTDALGMMLLDEQDQSLTPLVFVKSTCTLIWERGCGSGTAAVGAYLACKAQKQIAAAIRQPGGTISVKASPNSNGQITDLSITGQVKMAARGTAYL